MITQSFPGQLGRYKILSKIGQGAFGDVYRARDTKFETEVAVKMLAPFVVRDPDAMGAVKREAQFTRALKHPNIVTVYDFDEAQGIYFLVMDLVQGESLEAMLKTQGAFALGRLLKIAEQLALALDYAHAKNVLHRDVKPSNILISPPDALHPYEHVTLTDFGLARAMSAYQSYGHGSISAVVYAAPEQFDEQPYTAASDLYSLGVVVYEMLTGRRPFSAETMAGLLNAIANKPAPPPSQLRAGIEPEVDVVIQRALAKKPAERFATGTEFAQALARARSESIARIAQEQRASKQREIETGQARLQALFAQAAQVVEIDPEKTLTLIAQIASEAPDYPELDDLRGRSQQLIAERERQARVAKLFADAQAVIETNPKQALMWLELIETEEPDYPELAEAKARAREKLRFRFRSGGTAQDVEELVRLCEANPHDAIWHLGQGHFEEWLKAIDQESLARAAEETSDSKRRGLSTPERGLKSFLDATGMQHSYHIPPTVPLPPKRRTATLNGFPSLIGCPILTIIAIALPVGGALVGMGLGQLAAQGAVLVFGGGNWECLTIPVFTLAGFGLGMIFLNRFK